MTGWNKEDFAFKTLLNRLMTDSDGKYFFNEIGGQTINVHLEEIWASHVDPSPAQAVLDGVAVLETQIVLTEDVTVPNQQTWIAKTLGGVRISDWISDKFGAAYVGHLYENSGSEIFPTDALDWFFNYQTGVLTMNGNPLSYSRPFKWTAYRYVGQKGIPEAAIAIGDGSPHGSVLGNLGAYYFDKLNTLFYKCISRPSGTDWQLI